MKPVGKSLPIYVPNCFLMVNGMMSALWWADWLNVQQSLVVASPAPLTLLIISGSPTPSHDITGLPPVHRQRKIHIMCLLGCPDVRCEMYSFHIRHYGLAQHVLSRGHIPRNKKLEHPVEASTFDHGAGEAI